MTAISSAGRCVANESFLTVAAKVVLAKWRAAWCGRIDWPLLTLLFAAFELADIITTNRAVGLPGNWEANPVMALSQAQLGDLWWLPKMAAVCVVCLAAPLTRRRWLMILFVCYGAVTVLGNLAAL